MSNNDKRRTSLSRLAKIRNRSAGDIGCAENVGVELVIDLLGASKKLSALVVLQYDYY